MDMTFKLNVTQDGLVLIKVDSNIKGGLIIPSVHKFAGRVYQVTEIDRGAFHGCSGLTSVVIPETVNKIGGGVFRGCKSLTHLIVSEGNKVYDSRNNCNAIIETLSDTLIVGLATTVIPDSVKIIGDAAFDGVSNLYSITIPNAVTKIGYDAFRETGLSFVDIPNSITEICSGAFYMCSGLTNITISASVKKIGGLVFNHSGLKSITVSEDNPYYDSRDNCNAIIETKSNKLVVGCSTTVIPYSVIEIGFKAFISCAQNLVIPNSVVKIGNEAFGNGQELIKVSIPNSVTEIGRHAFAGCI